MPQYHFLVRNSKAHPTEETHIELPDDDAAIENPRVALSAAMHEAIVVRRLLDVEIVIVNEHGATIAVVSCDGGTKH
jgi:hypothetical protein